MKSMQESSATRGAFSRSGLIRELTETSANCRRVGKDRQRDWWGAKLLVRNQFWRTVIIACRLLSAFLRFMARSVSIAASKGATAGAAPK